MSTKITKILGMPGGMNAGFETAIYALFYGQILGAFFDIVFPPGVQANAGPTVPFVVIPTDELINRVFDHINVFEDVSAHVFN